MHWPGRPPSVDILLGTPQSWVRLGREDAVRFCRTLPVAVAYLNLGQSVSAWLSPESPFYQASGPYDYASLRYFLFGGSPGTGTAGGGRGRPQKATKADAAEEMEPVPADAFESWEETAEGAATVSPAKPPSPAPRPGLPKPSPIPPAPGLPSQPELPGFEEAPELPGIPAPEKLPIEIRLVDALGKPMADARYSLLLPDRSRKQGKTDASGFIRLPDNTLPGEVDLVLEGLA